MPIIFAPLFFGSVHTWAFSVLNLLIFGTALYHLGRSITGRGAAKRMQVPALGWYIGFVCITALQLIPLPPGLLERLSPTAGHIFGATNGFLDISSWRPLSLVPFATTAGLTKTLAYGTMFVLLIHTCRNRTKTTALVRTLIFLGAALALYGLFEKLTGHDHIWWFKSRQHGGFRVTGTFINPDHFGTFLAMLVPLAFGYVYRTRITAPLPQHERRKLSLLKRTMAHLFDPEAGAQKAGLLLFLCGMMAVALIMTGSRGAILALGGGFLIMSALVLAKTRRKGFALLLMAAITVVIIYGAQIGIDQSLSRFSKVDMGLNGRIAFLTHAWTVMKHFLLTGTGLGTFPEVFEPFKPESFARVFVNQLHNDWGEILSDTGLPGVLCLIIGYAALMLTLIRTWWTRTDPFAVGIGLGAIGGLTAAAIHELVDFGLRMPGNAVIFVGIAAAGWSAMTVKGKKRVKKKGLRVKEKRREALGEGRWEEERGKAEGGRVKEEEKEKSQVRVRPCESVRVRAEIAMPHTTPGPEAGPRAAEPQRGHAEKAKEFFSNKTSSNSRIPESQNSEISSPNSPSPIASRLSSSLTLNPFPLTLALILLWAAYTTVAIFRADLACSTERNSTLNRDMNPPVVSVEKAAALTPSNSLVWAKLAVALATEGPEQGETSRAHQTSIQQAWERAVSLNPMDGDLWYRLSQSYGRPSTRKWSKDQRRTRRDTATMAATLLRPKDAGLLADAGRYFAWRAKTLPNRTAQNLPAIQAGDFTWWQNWHETGHLPLPATRPQSLALASNLMRTAITRNRGLWKQCVEAMWQYTKDEEMVRAVVPEENGWVEKQVEKWLKGGGKG